jgi:hypothetical protein
MSDLSLIVDGMMSGTGIRALGGSYLEPADIGISEELQEQISVWLRRYEQAHFYGFEDERNNENLDQEGIRLTKQIKAELPRASVRYFSNAKLTFVEF